MQEYRVKEQLGGPQMQRSLRPIAAAVLATLVLSPIPAAIGQDDVPQAEFEGRVVVREVLLDVLVTDNKGNVILGLEPADFVVEEDGAAVEVTGATFYSNRRLVESSPSLSTVAVDQVPVDRYFILVFHDQRQDIPEIAATQLDAARQARRWVEEDHLPNDWVAVASYDYKLKVQQDFTTDRSKILTAIDEAVVGKDPGKNWPSRQAIEEGPSLMRNLPKGKELRRQTKRFYSAMELLADAAGQVIGRKNLILFSSGFGDLNGVGAYTPDIRFYPPMMQELNDNNVAVYSIDMIDSAFTVRSRDSSLSNLSSDTGGTYYTNFTTFLTPLKKVGEDNNGYYLLSYKTEVPANKRGYQKVKVRTRNPDFRVRSREGYKLGTGA